MPAIHVSDPKRATVRRSSSDWSERRSLGWLVAGLFGVLLIMLIADRPLAVAVSHWPELSVHIGAVTNPIEGFYFILFALAAALVSLVAFLAGPNRISHPSREAFINASFVFCAAILALAVASLLKFVIGRARPELLGLFGPFSFSPFSTEKRLTSFPSGETTMAASFFGAIAWMVWRRLGRTAAFIALVPAVLIAASRVAVGAHYLSDVLAAMLLSAIVVVWLGRVLHARRAAIAERLDDGRAGLREALRPG